MISIASLEVRSFTLDFLDLRWEVANTTEDITLYTFQVQRSESPEGPFENISEPLSETFSFRDDRVNLSSAWRIFYYKIEVVEVSTGKKGYSAVSRLGMKPDLVALELSRLHQGLLKRDIGTPMVILKRRTTGPSCPSCYDPVLRRVVESNCPVCLGTSQYRGGYLDPIGTFVHTSPVSKSRSSSSLSQTDTSMRMFDLSGYPLLTIGDVLVDPENNRFRVTSINTRAKRGFIYRQQPQVAMIPRGDEAYNLKITWEMFPDSDGEALWPKPASFGPIDPGLRRKPSDDVI